MTITMQTTRSSTIEELEQLITTTDGLRFHSARRDEAYQWIEGIARSYDYLHRAKKEKGVIQRYLQTMTGYPRQHITRLIGTFRRTTHIQVAAYRRHRFPRRYTVEDVALLADVDLTHDVLSGPATKQILLREFVVFRDGRYERLSRISPSHIANLRKTYFYREKTRLFQKTHPTQVSIGERRKPAPNGEPGYLRVDSVHQGDAPDGTKGVYHVNLVDEVLQWELVVCVEGISERFLVPALEAILKQFPFVLQGVHADNGSEFINRTVAGILEKLRIKLTKSRPRHSNDNGLVETKNGSIVRKYLGYGHIPQRHAAAINGWYVAWLNVYLNFHRPCAFGTEVIVNEQTGKRKRIYPTEDYRTPYEMFRSLPNAVQFLKSGVTLASLDQIAHAESDTVFAKKMQTAKQALFTSFTRS